MPSEYVEDPEDEFDYVSDWKELIDTTQPGGGDLTSPREQEAVLVGLIPFNKVRSAEKWWLGQTTCDTSSPYRLHRRPPCRHPRRPHLFADNFHSVGFIPKTHAPDETEVPDPETGDPVAADPTGGTWEESEWTDPDGNPLKYGEYEYAICTVRFKSFRRVFLLDDTYMPEADDWYKYEWQRFSEITIGPQTQALQADGSSNLTFLEGSPPGAPPYGTAFPSPLAELMAKCNVRVRWMNVPHEYLSNNIYYLNPTKIISCLGRVSNAVHIGFPANTMLLLAAEFEPTLMPVVSDDPDIPFTGWDVILSYEQFDPPKGVADTPPGTSVYRGHRLFPYRVDGKWYYAARENGVDELLPLADLNVVFKHVNDT